MGTEFLKERLILSYSLRKVHTESLQDYLARMMPKDNPFARLTRSDYAIIRAVWNVK